MYLENSVNSSVGSIYHATLKNCCLEQQFSFNNLWRRNIGKRTMLEFNIGPSFLHMIFYNNFTGRSFSYLFDCSNCVRSNIFKAKAKQLIDIETTRLNTEQSHLFKVNIFKEKCGCAKCLSASYLFYSCQPVHLTNELVQVLTSEHCFNWNRCWIEMVLEQMFVFLSCIKNGVIYERLLECACGCANMMVMKHSNTHLLDYKFSYQYFVEKLIANFQLVCKYRNNNYRVKDKSKSVYCGREIGKVYFDLVENFAIITFESEKEMNAYTKYENQIKKTRPQYFINSFRKSIERYDDLVGIKRNCKSKVKEIALNKFRLVCKSSERAAMVNGGDNESVDENHHQKQFNDKSMENQSFANRETIALPNNHYLSGLQTTVTNRNEENKYKLNKFMEREEAGSRDSRERETVPVKWNRIPVMHGCNRRWCNNIVQCSCKSFSLGMLLTFGNRRSLHKQTIENLKLLENNETTVSFRLATIAASALLNDKQFAVRRIIVPVVLSDIVKLAKHLKLPRNVDGRKVIDKEVEDLVNELLDQVCFSESDVNSGSEHSQLLNEKNNLKESFEEDVNKAANKTVIKSSNQEEKLNNISRLTKRSKREVKMSSRFNNSVFFDEASLPLATSVFQGSRSLGTQRRMEFVSDERRKRKVKSVTDECLKGKVELTHDVCKKKKLELTNDLCKKQKMDVIIDAWKKRGSSTVLRKLDFSVGNIDEKKTLADILIWCVYHDRYNCPCILSVCRMKHNLVIWEPPKILKYVTYKVMSKVDIDIKQKESCQVFFFDSEEFCARSYGAPINYSLRNNTELFSAKRRYELENNVTTSTNSFIKFKYSIFKSVFNMEDEGMNNMERYGDVIRYECKENVYLVADEEENDIEIDVGRPSADVIVISDNEEDAHHQRSSLALDLDKLTINSYSQRTPSVTKHIWRNDKSSSPKTYSKSKKKLVNKSEHSCAQQAHNNKQDENLIRNSNEEQNKNEDTKILERNLQRPEVEVNVKTPLKQLKSYLFQQNSIDITNYDSSLENGLLRLKDHPLKDDIYCENKLPKLALYCVTPGIGYLPIVEYTAKALVVFDPIFPQVLHSFKNLSSANMWLNKFLKDFLVFQSIDISLKWIIVKPGIIKMKQSQPFSPAIFENSPIIITKHGEIRFSKKELITSFENKTQEVREYKRKMIRDTVVDIKGSDGKRKKIHLDCLGPIRAKILTRTVNLVQQYPSKKSTILPDTNVTTTQLLNQNKINSELSNCSPLRNNIATTFNSGNNVSPFDKQLKISPKKQCKLIPANLLIEMNMPSTLLNNNNNLLHSKYGYICSSSCSLQNASDGRSPIILSNNFNNSEMIITDENDTQSILTVAHK